MNLLNFYSDSLVIICFSLESCSISLEFFCFQQLGSNSFSFFPCLLHNTATKQLYW